MRYLIILVCTPILQYGTAQLFRYITPESAMLTKTGAFLMQYIKIFLQQFVSVCIPVLILFRKKKYFPRDEFTVAKPGYYFRCIWLGFLLQFIGIAVNLPISVALQTFGFSPPSSLSVAKNALQFMMQTLVVCLTPAVFEEVLFRRIIFDSIRKYSVKTAIFLSALFFAMAHLDFYNFGATFFIGLMLGLLRAKGAPLILCVITHFFVNFTASILNLLLQHDFIASLFSQYSVLLYILAAVFFMLSFPKKMASENEIVHQSAESYLKKLFCHPLFYLYITIFFIIGVKNI
ncbi:MAG: CPBP family intramembrane metalloprotease [Clostridia bacterium]|nr:CPBP family intramembrane metalloprotease [Clostridia bacterium]